MDRPGEPTIRECVPTAGPVGSRVVIHGVNFGKTAEERIVSFNSVVADEVDNNASGAVDPGQAKTRERGAADQKNLQSRQAPAGAVAESEKAAAANQTEAGKREIDQKNAQAAPVTGPAQTSAAKQPGDVAAQTQGAASNAAGGVEFPAVERGEAEHGVSGAAATAVVTHKNADPSTEETITVTVPEGATPGDIVVTVAGIASNGSRFTVTAV